MRFYDYLYLPVILLTGIGAAYFCDFTADDAYITYRYAENLVNTGALVFNGGEAINALTSPLHALVSSALFYVTGHTVLSNKVLASFLVLISILLTWRRFRDQPEQQLLVLLLVLLPPCTLLWTFGGLETPLLFFLATSTVVLVDRNSASAFSLKMVCTVSLLAGLGFLTRYDSVLFFAPITLFVALKARTLRHVVIGFMAGALLPTVWITISIVYYGDVLPTSFYIKTPHVALLTLLKNGSYICIFLLCTGVVPALLLPLLFPLKARTAFQLLSRNVKTMWWLHLGIFLELLYGLTMAATHMMFSFRHFVPYLASTAIIVVELIRQAAETTKEGNLHSGRAARVFKGALVCLLLFQSYQILYTYRNSVNGISLVGEYRRVGVRDYVKFMDALKRGSEDIMQHWNKVKANRSRRPRIRTAEGGILPYTFQESYVYTTIVSPRSRSSKKDLLEEMPVDYFHILAPRHGSAQQQLPQPIEDYSLISSYEIDFESKQSLLVYYSSNPE